MAEIAEPVAGDQKEVIDIVEDKRESDVRPALNRRFRRRTEGQSKRVRCIMIVALARKLAIALWRYVELGLIPEGAVVK